MAPAQLAEIYVTASTALRTILGHHLSFLPVTVSHCLPSACYQPVFKFLLNLSHFQTHKHTEEIRHVCHITNYFYLSPRVICWAVQKVWPTSQRPNQFPTACAGSSSLLVDSSFWVVIGRWSLRTQTRCTHLQETQVHQKYRNLFFSICFFFLSYHITNFTHFMQCGVCSVAYTQRKSSKGFGHWFGCPFEFFSFKVVVFVTFYQTLHAISAVGF